MRATTICSMLWVASITSGCFNTHEPISPLSDTLSTPINNPSPPAKDANVALAQSTLDSTSDGGTITFQDIGSAGWYPSRRDPSVGPCDADSSSTCCMAKHVITSDSLTPWNEELIMTLRGPMLVQQIAVYQPDTILSSVWDLVSIWDSKNPAASSGIAFSGNATQSSVFAGTIGNTCLVNVSTAKVFPCGPGSIPYCPSSATPQYFGWAGSKMIIVRAYMPHVSSDVIY